jgi:hypothetical protein
MTERFPTSYEKLVALADGTKYEHVANDRAKLERLLIEAMRTSTDPMTREIGSGLADGSLTWRTVGTSSAYADYVQRSLDAMQTFDFGAVVSDMEQEKAEAERSARRQDEDEDPDELWQGFNRGHQ